MITIKSDYEMEAMRAAGRIIATLWEPIGRKMRPGVTTAELDRVAEEHIRGQGGVPAFKGYRGYPATICASVNEEVVHGIPGPRVLREGDIIGLDVGAKVDGFYSDAARTFPIGRVDSTKARLIETAREALERGIGQARPRNRISDISHAIQRHVEAEGFSVVRKYVGHGIGAELHEEPQVPNFGRPHEGPAIRTGMALAIEPMVNAGGPDVVLQHNGWTVRTRDGKASSHFEDTVLITDAGAEILTR